MRMVAALFGLVGAAGLLACFVASLVIWVETVRLLGA
jgi:hypothetical protein